MCTLAQGRISRDNGRTWMTMKPVSGIQYVTEEKGQRVAVLIDLNMHRALGEDIEDLLVSRLRRHEKRIPLEQYRAQRQKRAGTRG